MMSDGGVAADIVLTQGGSRALDILTANGVGRVAAIFEHSFYAAFDRSWVCLGPATLPMGPLNVRSSAPEGMIGESRFLQIDDPVFSSAGRLRVGQAFEFGTGNAVAWYPPAPPPWTAETVKVGLDGLDRLAGPRADVGLAGFVLADRTRIPLNKVVAAARQPIDVLSGAFERAFRDESLNLSDFDGAVIALLGLGPGLTPSGDDFLGGMLLVLGILPAPALRAHLRAVIDHHAPKRTNAISMAHLRAAGAGSGHEVLHEALSSLLGCYTEALPAQLAAIGRIGHSSGWDALAGICVALRAYLAARAGVQD